MIDGHIHIERGDYSLPWIEKFVAKAAERDLEEIWLLEHCYRFREFVPMYDSICGRSAYIDEWFRQRAGVLDLADYLALIQKVRERSFPVKIKFGLEICYFKGSEAFVASLTENRGFDFLLGSIHFVDGFAFDHKAEHWIGADVDEIYRRYFELSADLIQSGIYDGIAHPDCVNLFGHVPSFPLTGYYEEIARLLSRRNMYAEQSSGIYRRCPGTAPLGMDREFLRSLKKHQARIVTVSDAHCPEDIGSHIEDLCRLIAEA